MGAKGRMVERVQTGLRMEKRIVQVLKAIGAKYDIGMSDVIEGIVLHSFEGKPPFGDEDIHFINQIRAAYGLDLTASDSHMLIEDE